MNHWIIAPIVIPAFSAALIVLFMRHHLSLARIFSVASTVAVLAVSLALTWSAAHNPPALYALGNWPAPFGIVLVLDRLSAMMVLLASVVGLIALLHAVNGWDARGRHFHALWQFQLMGINGAFLTGDLFNLFVFFEVLLIASYGLMLHGAGRERLRAGVHYVMINLVGSSLFLIGVGLIYGMTGTLNMADLAVKVPLVAEADQALLRTGALVLLIVFAIKAALVPLHLWLPGTYANAPAPVAALFAIMTKVGAYAIIRVYTLIFGGDAGASAWMAADWLLPAALVTIAVGAAGVLAARGLGWLVAFATIGSMGTLLAAVGLFTETGMTAALYYLLHSTLTVAALFLVADLIAARRGAHGGTLDIAPRFAQAEALGALFFLGAIAMAGLPPLSGFIGKLLILDSARDPGTAPWIWAAILIASLVTTIGFARAGSRLFWKSTAEDGTIEAAPQPRPALMIGIAALPLALLVGLTVAAGPVSDYLAATAADLFDSSAYIAAVLPPGLKAAP
ncbi:monovalent cation/H+ antiporter subunit D [Iodidimonas sp. SYSU 1G8]|uniref:monovalent cation/H+ antiporter subunit D n=1 Tax=Iodidimonas sp. SYSU 1G8 TaxID=3133967 RepID=UPI0031FF1A56